MTLLDAVRTAREHRDNAESTFRRTLAEASEHHSLRQLSEASSLTVSGVRYLLDQERGSHEDERSRQRDRPPRISTWRTASRAHQLGELAELQSLAASIDPSDVELLEAAGVPEHAEDEKP